MFGTFKDVNYKKDRLQGLPRSPKVHIETHE